MMDDAYAVILVYSIGHALQAEKVLREAGIACKLIPVPRHLSSDCGSCLRILRTDRETAKALLEARRIEIRGLHEV